MLQVNRARSIKGGWLVSVLDFGTRLATAPCDIRLQREPAQATGISVRMAPCDVRLGAQK